MTYDTRVKPFKYAPDGGFRRLRRFAENDAPCLTIEDEAGNLIARASVNVNAGLPANYTAIKDWSENEGILWALVDSGHVEATGMEISCGFVNADIVRIKPGFLKAAEQELGNG